MGSELQDEHQIQHVGQQMAHGQISFPGTTALGKPSFPKGFVGAPIAPIIKLRMNPFHSQLRPGRTLGGPTPSPKAILNAAGTPHNHQQVSKSIKRDMFFRGPPPSPTFPRRSCGRTLLCCLQRTDLARLLNNSCCHPATDPFGLSLGPYTLHVFSPLKFTATIELN